MEKGLLSAVGDTMSAKTDGMRGVKLVAPLSALPFAKRWLALHEPTQTSRMMYLFSRGEVAERCGGAVEALAGLSHSHVLGIDAVETDTKGDLWVLTPYPGNQHGLVTLGALLEAKGGRMNPYEAARAVEHLLDAARAAHAQRMCHGWMSIDEVLVDPRGRLLVELYGVPRKGGRRVFSEDLMRDELASIAAIGYRLVTGRSADEPRIQAGRIVSKLDRSFEVFLERGLDASNGFESAEAAIACLKGEGEMPSDRGVRGAAAGVFGRLRKVVVRPGGARLESRLESGIDPELRGFGGTGRG